VGEFELLAKVRERLTEGGPRVRVGSGDDAAVTVPGGATATSVDALIEGVHFRRELSPPASTGSKALAAALSDLGAMGAEPGEAYVIVGVPDDLDEEGCMEVLDGVKRLADETRTTLAGGDVTRSPVLLLAVTVVGHAAAPEDLVRRSGARVGDSVVLTGELGGAAAGLRLLQEPSLGEELEADVASLLRLRQLEPWPRLAEGAMLAAARASAMIDVSDGLGADAGHLATASGVRLRIDLDRVPLQDGVAELAAAAGVESHVLAQGGEDYELLASLPPDDVREAQAALDSRECPLTVIGVVEEGEGVELSGPSGPIDPLGFDQLA
jgi:thiamine-monophosphate kinase